MDPRDKDLLLKTFELSQENNKILHSMRRSMRWAQAARIFYWVLIIGASIGAYYYIQPYIDQLLQVYSGIGGTAETFQKFFKP